MARILLNYCYMESEGKPVRRGLPVFDIAQKFIDLVHPVKLRYFAGQIVAIDEGDGDSRPVIKTFKNDVQLLGWAQSKDISLAWATRAEGCVTRADFYVALCALLPEVAGIQELPQFPLAENVYYTSKREYGDSYTGRLDELVDFWLPYTANDRSLIKAAFCTPFWGGRPGGRPAISIESDGSDNGRGVGKSQLLYAIANIAGGHIDGLLSEDLNQIKKRLLSKEPHINVVAFDNCKTTKVSSGDLEGLITAPAVSGWRPHFGNGSITNTLTYLFSMNDPAFSADMASRSVRIILSRRPVDGTWEARLDRFIETHRHDVINDCIYLLKKESVAHKSYIRFSSWQRDVLSKIDSSDELADLMISRQKAVDADADHSSDICGMIADALSEHERPDGQFSTKNLDPDGDVVLVARAVLCNWLRARLDRRASDSSLTRMVARAKIPQLSEHPTVRRGIRYWRWNPHLTLVPEGAWRIDKSDRHAVVRWHRFDADGGAVVNLHHQVHHLNAPVKS